MAKQADAFVHEVYKRSNNPSEKPSRKMLECTRDIFSKFPQSVKSVIYKKGWESLDSEVVPNSATYNFDLKKFNRDVFLCGLKDKNITAEQAMKILRESRDFHATHSEEEKKQIRAELKRKVAVSDIKMSLHRLLLACGKFWKASGPGSNCSLEVVSKHYGLKKSSETQITIVNPKEANFHATAQSKAGFKWKLDYTGLMSPVETGP